MIDTIIFDGEGVVIDSESIWDRGQEEFLRRRGLQYDRKRIKPLITGKSLVDGILIMKREYGLPGDLKELARERTEIVKRFFEQEVTYIDGFRDFFESVREKFKTCMATALDNKLLRIVDRRLGLSALFGGRIFTLAHVGYRSKPHPDLLLFAAGRLGSKPQNCLVIEDAPLGIEAARNAGMKCVALTTTYDREKLARSDLVVDSFSEIDISGDPSQRSIG